MKISKFATTLLTLIILIGSIYVLRFISTRVLDHFKEESFLKVKGNPAAPVHIIEYSDFFCPACRRGSGELKKLFQKYPDQIYRQYRFFPLARLHPQIMDLCLFAQCAAQQHQFWTYYDLLMRDQQNLKKMGKPRSYLFGLAREAQLNLSELKKCLADPQTLSKILADQQRGKRKKVEATPTYFVNGKKIVGYFKLKNEIQKQLQDN